MAHQTVNPLDVMDECVQLALTGRGRTKTNPIVGAVVIKDGKVAGRGCHEEHGGPHAEVMAINAAGDVRGADIYVTLEPCSHHGKTPPCVDKIIASGIKRVFVGVVDPNPVNAGKGLQKLLDAGLDVFLGYREELCAAVIEDFTKSVLEKKPYFSVKTASSLDGKLATKTGDSKWISSSSSRTFVHYLRSVSDAVLVGVNTVIADDPRLTVRESFEDNDPYKIVIDPDGKIPVRCGLVKNSAERLIWVTGTFGKHDCADILRDKGATVIELNSQNGYLDLHQLAGKLYGLNIMNVLIEGGGETAGGFFDAGLVDKGYFFLAPKIIGGRMAVSAVGGEGVSFVKDAPVMLETDVRRFEDDFLISGRFKDYRTHVLELTEKLRNRCSLGL